MTGARSPASLRCGCQGVACLWDKLAVGPLARNPGYPLLPCPPWVRGQSLCGRQSRLARTPSPSSSFSQPPPFCSPPAPFMG